MEIIKNVWMYTFFNTYLSLLEQREKNLFEIKLPYIGKIILRFKDGDPEFESFIILDQNTKEIIKNLKAGNDSGLVDYFKENFIDKVITHITES